MDSDIPVSGFLKSELPSLPFFLLIFADECSATEHTARAYLAQQQCISAHLKSGLRSFSMFELLDAYHL